MALQRMQGVNDRGDICLEGWDLDSHLPPVFVLMGNEDDALGHDV